MRTHYRIKLSNGRFVTGVGKSNGGFTTTSEPPMQFDSIHKLLLFCRRSTPPTEMVVPVDMKIVRMTPKPTPLYDEREIF